MGRIEDIKAELTAGHPDTGAYNVDDQLAADEMNAINRPADGGIEAMLRYCVENRSRTNDGTDLTPRPLLVRLRLLAEATASSNPFGSSGLSVTQEQIDYAENFLAIVQSPHLTQINFTHTEISGMLDALNTAKVWKVGDVDALKGLSDNKQSRGSEIGVGRVRKGDVETARALP